MKLDDYKKLTIIMRNYTDEQAELVARVASKYGDKAVIEITLNSDNAYKQIKELNNKYGQNIAIGAGTVLSLETLKKAHAKGAKFALGPRTFSQEMLDYCKDNELVSIPAGMTPSEISDLIWQGADIVKVFPAAVVGARFFKDIEGPFGKLPLMAVGGINKNNILEFKDNGVNYFGIGSSMFNKEDLESLNESGIDKSIQEILGLIY